MTSHPTQPADSAPAAGTAPSVPSSFDRRHDLDALRATAMLLGIVLHASLAYVTFPFWAVYDDRHSAVFDLLVSVIHSFRMPVFFMLSGFFTAMLWRKRGIGSLAKHRVKRILLPLLLFLVTIIPLQMGILALIYGAVPMGGQDYGSPRVENLWDAAKHNDVASLKRFIEEEDDLDRYGPEHELPALNWAALNGSTEAARLLIEAGADVHVVSGDNSTPLSHAAFTGRADIAKMLLEAGADPNVVNDHQTTALDNTETDWGIVQWVAGAIGLQVDQESLEKGRKEIRALLRQHGGKFGGELGREAGAPERRQDDRTGGVREAYESIKGWPIFHLGQIFHHLWFLWHLCLLLIPFLLYALVADALKWRGPPKWLFRSPWVFLWILPLTMLPQSLHGDIGPDTTIALVPFPHIIGLYFVYFFFGAFYWDCDDREGRLSRYWWVMLPLALIALYPLAAALTHDPEAAWIPAWLRGGAGPLVKVLAQVLFVWFMIFGLMGLFRALCRRENRIVRYVSDSSYWLYVAHLPLIFVAQHLVKPLDAPAAVKFGIVCVSVTAVLLLTYDFCIRYTWVGTLLNGPRSRPTKRLRHRPAAE